MNDLSAAVLFGNVIRSKGIGHVRGSLSSIPLRPMTIPVVVMPIVPMFPSLVKERFQESDSLGIFLRETRYLK
jgi:hypothetical protein